MTHDRSDSRLLEGAANVFRALRQQLAAYANQVEQNAKKVLP